MATVRSRTSCRSPRRNTCTSRMRDLPYDVRDRDALEEIEGIGMATGHEFINLADLASARVGGRAIATNDDFFAAKSNLVKPEPAVFIPGKYTTRGKWMDGWESRRRRVPGNDWCIVQLGMRGIVHGVNVDTSHFTGNYPSHCSIEALDSPRGVKAS